MVTILTLAISIIGLIKWYKCSWSNKS
jgi:hypothetical protein